MMRQIANFFSFIVAGILLLMAFAVAQWWPASFWFDVRAVRVFDTYADQPVIMAVDRTIARDFRGEWVTSIRRFESGGWVQYCTATGAANYAVDSKLPDPITLEWWTYPDCHPLPPGKYAMRTTWVIHGSNLLPDKEVQADSNIFEVKP